MSDVALGIISNLICGIITGIITGYYTGIIITRLAKFNAIKTRMSNFVNGIQGGGTVGTPCDNFSLPANYVFLHEIKNDMSRKRDIGMPDWGSEP